MQVHFRVYNHIFGFQSLFSGLRNRIRFLDPEIRCMAPNSGPDTHGQKAGNKYHIKRMVSCYKKRCTTEEVYLTLPAALTSPLLFICLYMGA